MAEMLLASTGQTRVQSVSVIPTTRRMCNAKCLPCISKMTPGAQEEKPTWVPIGRVNDILDYGRQAGAMTAIITSKSEPTIDLVSNPQAFGEIVTACRSKLPQVDIHTNGLLLVQGDRLKKLVDWGLNMVTFSIASFDADKNKQIMGVRQPVQTLINTANQLDILVRCSLLLTKKTAHNPATIIEYVRQARELGADMVVCRELWLPACPNDDSEEIQSWVKANHVNMKRLEQAFLKASKGEVQYDLPIRLIRLLPWGARVYDVGGVNVSFAHCDERFNNGTYKSIQLVPRTKPWGAINWRIQGSWDSTGDVLG